MKYAMLYYLFISSVSVNSQQTIEVKPMIKEKTNFAGDSPASGPGHPAASPEKERKEVTEGNEKKKPIENLPDNVDRKPETKNKQTAMQNEDSLPEHTKREKTFTKTKDTDSPEKKLNNDDHGKADGNENKIVKKLSEENLENTKLEDDSNLENEAENAKKVEKKGNKKRKKRDKSRGDESGAVKQKLKPLNECKTSDAPEESDKAENVRDSRSASRESNTSQTSKKSNNVFGDTVAQGLAGKPRKERHRKKPKKKDLGVVNLGADNEEKPQTEEKKVTEDTKESKESQKEIVLREAPSLKDKTGKITIFTSCCPFLIECPDYNCLLVSIHRFYISKFEMTKGQNRRQEFKLPTLIYWSSAFGNTFKSIEIPT